MEFKGKRVLITGSGSGIGLATARAFLERGAAVAINDLTLDTVQKAIAGLPAGRRVAAPGSVASPADCAAIVAQAVEGLGGLDVLVNNAGIYREAPIEGTDEALWDAVLDVNLKGTFFMSKAAAPHLKQSRGAIVNLASEAGIVGTPNIGAYAASKAGVVGLTRALAMELVSSVRVTCVCPAPTETPLFDRTVEALPDREAYFAALRNYTPMKRLAKPVEIARAILFLASDDASFVTGTALMVDGGVTAGSTAL